MRLIVSGYSTEGYPSVAVCGFSVQTKESKLLWTDRIPSPSFLSVDFEGFFAASERMEDAEILQYRRSEEGYCPVGKVAFQGGLLCHLSLSRKHQALFGSCYDTGHVAAVPLKGGVISGPLHVSVSGESMGKLSRAHCSVTDPQEDRLYTVNISQDRIYCSNLSQGGDLEENPKFPWLTLASGHGPRHLLFHKGLSVAYLITEYSNQIFVLGHEKSSGKLSVLQEISTLPVGHSGESYGSALALSEDGRYLYAANRGADSIAVYFVQSDGLLQKQQDCSCGGCWPRHIALSKDGSCLLSANQRSNDIAILELSSKNGGIVGQTGKILFAAPAYVEEIEA